MGIPVKLEAFEGPLDLLLHLIEKNKIDIYDIPIVEITEQYMEYIRQMQEENLNIMSEFMVMAATLLDIKCKMLLPKEITEEGEEKDPREELVQQLLEYKMYKYMSYELRDRMADASRCVYRAESMPKEVLEYRPPVDIQELIGKDKTQNTFFHIFNHLHLLGKQLILTSDKAPVDLQGMEERLITRLKWGLTAELDRPDLDLRKKILKNKISHDGVVIPDDVFNFIASNVTENVRDVEGIVASLLAYSTAFNRMIDLPLTKQVVSRVVKLEKKQVSVESIQDVVCKYYNLELAAIQTNSRKREIVQARQVTMYLAKKYTDSSFSHIGKIVGKRDHATVLHACKTVRDQIETNKSFRSSVEEIEALLKA